MAEISAAAVKALREKTGLPMMDCKRALEEAGGDADAAIDLLRKAGKKTMEKRVGRETSAGRIAIIASLDPGIGAMVELRCESAPVANNRSSWAWPAIWPSNWPSGPARQLPSNCSRSLRRANRARRSSSSSMI
jgi:elongation factor Ts